MSQTDDDAWAAAFDEHPRIESGSGSSVEHFKWGWNAETGEATVWRVGGGPDGPPFHDQHLTEAWGRPPSWSAGDLLGIAVETNGIGFSITPYYGKHVPESVASWFEATFPADTVH